MYIAAHDLFEGKTQAVRDLYHLLLDNLNRIGPVHEFPKETSVSLENRKTFASAIIRNRSIKLVLRNGHRIASSRIHHTEQVAKNSYQHTILLESKSDIDEELMKWLGDAYQAGK